MDVDSLLDHAATSSGNKKKKSEVPIFQASAKVAKAILAWLKAKAAEKDALAKIASAAEEIVPEATKLHQAEVRKLGRVITTIKMASGDKTIQVDMAKQQYSKIPKENEDQLKECFGDKFDDYFDKERTVTLSAEALKDKDIIAKLVKAVGKDNFGKYFEVKVHYTPTAKFHADRFLTDGDDIPKAISEELVKPFKVAMRG